MIFRLSTILLFISVLVIGQETLDKERLVRGAEKNYFSISKSPEKGFAWAKEIQAEAKRTNNQLAELMAMNTLVYYYYLTLNYEKMISSSKELYKKAKSYEDPIYMTQAKIRLSEAYFSIELPKEALKELEEGNKIINTVNNKDSLTIGTRSYLYYSYANYYSSQNRIYDQIKYIKKAIEEEKNFPDQEDRIQNESVHYSNLGLIYTDADMDSALYYANKSIETENGYKLNQILFNFYFVNGLYFDDKGDCEKAISYFEKAEGLKVVQNPVNLIILYESLIKCQNTQNDRQKLAVYKQKLDSLNSNNTKNQNKSLHKILSEKEEKNNKLQILLWIGLAVFLLISIYLLVKYLRVARREKISGKYLDSYKELNKKDADTIKLMEMFKNNDICFMTLFEQIYPEFIEKIKNHCLQISKTELEFCAFLKLKLSTKEIAMYKHLAPRTVQNKKHLIRKKLNIPENIDIYKWIEEL